MKEGENATYDYEEFGLKGVNCKPNSDEFQFIFVIFIIKSPLTKHKQMCPCSRWQFCCKQWICLQPTMPLSRILGHQRCNAQIEEWTTQLESTAPHPPLLLLTGSRKICAGILKIGKNYFFFIENDVKSIRNYPDPIFYLHASLSILNQNSQI